MTRLRSLLVAAALLLVSAPRAEAFTALRGTAQNCSNTGTNQIPTCLLLNANIDAGDVCAVTVNVRTTSAESVTSITDDRSNVWALALRHTGNATYGDQFTEIWLTIATSGADTAATVNFSGNVTSDVGFGCFSGSPATIAVTSTGTGLNDAGTSHGTSSVSCGTSGIFVTTTSLDAGFTLSATDTGYTTLRSGSRMFAQYRVPTGAESDDGAWTSTTGLDSISAQICITDGAAVATGGRGPILIGVGE